MMILFEIASVLFCAGLAFYIYSLLNLLGKQELFLIKNIHDIKMQLNHIESECNYIANQFLLKDSGKDQKT